MPAGTCDAIENSKRYVGVRLTQVHAAAIFADQRLAQGSINGFARARRQAPKLALRQWTLMRAVAAGARVRTLIELGWTLSGQHKSRAARFFADRGGVSGGRQKKSR
jgi:hypothetical protein